jgi:hypothetical protein
MSFQDGTYRDVLNAVMQRRIRHPNDRTEAEIAAGVTPVDYARTEGDIRRYGALTAAADNSAAIQAAIDVYGQGGAAVYIPPGNWTITTGLDASALPATRGLRMYGDGYLTSNIIIAPGVVGFTYEPVAYTESGITLESLSIRGASSVDAGNLLQIGNCTWLTLRGVRLRNTAGDCIKFTDQVIGFKIYDLIAESFSGYVIEMAAAIGGSVSTWVGGQVNGNAVTAQGVIGLTGSGSADIVNLIGVNVNGGTTRIPNFIRVNDGTGIADLQIRGCYAELLSGSPIVASGTAQINRMQVENCNLQGNNSIQIDLNNGVAHQDIVIKNVRSPISANTFFHPGATRNYEVENISLDGGTRISGFTSAADRVKLYTDGRIEVNGRKRQLIGPWTYTDVTASLSNAAMTGTRWVSPRAGSVTGIVIKSNEARTAGTATARSFVNTGLAGAAGTEILLAAQLNGTDTSSATNIQNPTTDTFAAGDEIFPKMDSSADWTPTTADVQVFIEIEV